MLNKRKMLDLLRSGEIVLPPLSIRLLELEDEEAGTGDSDALIEISWGRKTAVFGAELSVLSTPKAIRDGIRKLQSVERSRKTLPILIVPYLDEQKLRLLEHEGVSALDLCGNGVVAAGSMFAVFRSGEANRYPSSALIKNVYRHKSSMVGRVLLVRGNFNTVQEIREEINARSPGVSSGDGKPMSLSTVSKVLKTLEEDLIITRNGGISLLQADQLLRRLNENYRAPDAVKKVRWKIPATGNSLPALLGEVARQKKLQLMATGLSSATRYAVMQRGPILSVYCTSVEEMLTSLPGERTDRFPNLELVETEDETVYFDSRPDDNFRWASPVQCYLELQQGDARDRDTAEQVKARLLQASETENP
jgi:hypothetical protein